MKKEMTIRPYLVSLIMIICSVSLVSPAFSFGPGPGAMAGAGLKMLRHLDLSAEQKETIEDILGTYQPLLADRMDAAKKAHKNTIETLDSQPFDETLTRQAFQQIAPLREEIFVLMAKIRNEIRAQLTDTQLELLETKRAERQERRHENKPFRQGMRRTWLNNDTE